MVEHFTFLDDFNNTWIIIIYEYYVFMCIAFLNVIKFYGMFDFEFILLFKNAIINRDAFILSLGELHLALVLPTRGRAKVM